MHTTAIALAQIVDRQLHGNPSRGENRPLVLERIRGMRAKSLGKYRNRDASDERKNGSAPIEILIRVLEDQSCGGAGGFAGAAAAAEPKRASRRAFKASTDCCLPASCCVRSSSLALPAVSLAELGFE